MDIEQKLNQLLVEHLGVTSDLIKPEARIAEDLGADSLDALDLLYAVNEKFKVKVNVEEMEDIQTVQQLIDAIQTKIAT